jgi:hypothetical protein
MDATVGGLYEHQNMTSFSGQSFQRSHPRGVLGLDAVDVGMERVDLAGRDVRPGKVVECSFQRTRFLMKNGQGPVEQRQPVQLRPHGHEPGSDLADVSLDLTDLSPDATRISLDLSDLSPDLKAG